MDDAAHLYTVNVAAPRDPTAPGPQARTAIDKPPVVGRVDVGPLGVAGDRQGNRKIHGGPDKAVYAFAREDVTHWERELDRAIAPGGFGENLSTLGLEVSEALIGERWRIGTGEDAVVVEVTMPRMPCMTFARWMGEPRSWIARFATYGRVGAYLRVVQPGVVQAGDRVEVVHRPAHSASAAAVLRGLSAAEAASLHAERAAVRLDLAPEVVAAMTQVL